MWTLLKMYYTKTKIKQPIETKLKIAKVNFWVLFFHLTAVVIVYSFMPIIVSIAGIPIAPASLIYPLTFATIDLVRAYSGSNRTAYTFVLIEFAFVFMWLGTIEIFSVFSQPMWAHVDNYYQIFNLMFEGLLANVLPVLLVIVLDLVLFGLFFYKVFKNLKKHMRFLVSSLLSTLLIVFSYVVIFDLIYTQQLFPQHWLLITKYDVIVFFVMSCFWTVVTTAVYKVINRYIKYD